jgi:hypothetical protein
VSVGEFAASLLFGLLSVLLPIAIFILMVAVCVYVARWWINRRSKPGV